MLQMTVYLLWKETTTQLFNFPVLQELMESVDCCLLPMTNRRQGNQLVVTGFNILPLNPGGGRSGSLESASDLIIKRQHFPKDGACTSVINSFS